MVSIFGNLTLPETNSSHLKMDGWKMKLGGGTVFPSGFPILYLNLLKVVGKKSKNILPNGGLMVIYHGRIRKKSP